MAWPIKTRAAAVRIHDEGDYYTGIDVEAALQEIAKGTTLDAHYLKLDQSTPQDTAGTFYLADVFKTLAGTVTRTDNYISQIAKTGGKTYTITRDGGYISTVTDTVKTLAITRNASNQITSWTIT